MKKESQEFHQFVMTMFADWEKQQSAITQAMRVEGDLKELTDYVYALKKTAGLLTEMEKQTRNAYEVGERLLCMLWAKNGDSEPIRTEHCTASPRIRMAAQIPKRGTPEYDELMTAFGVSDELRQSDAVRPHWPGLIDFVTGALTEGRPVPKGIDITKTYPVYGVQFRDKKGVTE